MLNFYYAGAARTGPISLKQGLQLPQGFTADRRRLRYLNFASRRIEHPFRQPCRTLLAMNVSTVYRCITAFRHAIVAQYVGYA